MARNNKPRDTKPSHKGRNVLAVVALTLFGAVVGAIAYLGNKKIDVSDFYTAKTPSTPPADNTKPASTEADEAKPADQQ